MSDLTCWATLFRWTSVCSKADEWAQNCALEGANYGSTYGASTSGNALTLKFVTKHEYGTNIGSRFYLMAGTGSSKYQMFTLMNNEFAFDVDTTKLPCGMNSALYLSEMVKDGAKSDLNTGGAAWGTGYCDAQCYVTPFINGEVRFVKKCPWIPSFLFFFPLHQKKRKKNMAQPNSANPGT